MRWAHVVQLGVASTLDICILVTHKSFDYIDFKYFA